MLLYTGIQTAAFGCMNTNNSHLSNQMRVRIVSCKSSHFVDTPFWHDALDIYEQI
jgi:hypothetical protein